MQGGPSFLLAWSGEEILPLMRLHSGASQHVGGLHGGGENPPPALATKKILIRGAFPTSSSPLRLASPRLVGRSVQAQQPGNTYGLRLGSKGGGKEDRK